MRTYQRIIAGGLVLAGLTGLLCCNKPNPEREESKPHYSQSVNVQSQGYKSGAIALDLGDVDSDGIQELVLGDLESVKLYRNDGRGNFTNPQTITPVQSRGYKSGALDLKLKDVDEDGDLDLVIGDLRGVLVFYNDGKGNFSQ